MTVALSGKRVFEALTETSSSEDVFARFVTPSKARMWINPTHVSVIEDRPDLD